MKRGARPEVVRCPNCGGRTRVVDGIVATHAARGLRDRCQLIGYPLTVGRLLVLAWPRHLDRCNRDPVLQGLRAAAYRDAVRRADLLDAMAAVLPRELPELSEDDLARLRSIYSDGRRRDR